MLVTFLGFSSYFGTMKSLGGDVSAGCFLRDAQSFSNLPGPSGQLVNTELFYRAALNKLKKARLVTLFLAYVWVVFLPEWLHGCKPMNTRLTNHTRQSCASPGVKTEEIRKGRILVGLRDILRVFLEILRLQKHIKPKNNQ